MSTTALAPVSWMTQELAQASEQVLALVQASARGVGLVVFCCTRPARQRPLMQAITYSFGQILRG